MLSIVTLQVQSGVNIRTKEHLVTTNFFYLSDLLLILIPKELTVSKNR